MAAPAIQLLDGAGCFHCGLPVPDGFDIAIEFEGKRRPVCCPGCEAVAELIIEQGLGDYYRRREAAATNPQELQGDGLEALRIFDDAEFARDFVCELDGCSQATLVLEDVRCAACAWLIERHLSRLPGIADARVHLTNHRLVVSWFPERLALSGIFDALAKLGYRARPFVADQQEAVVAEEERQALRRLGVAGLGAMQVMMFAVALYAGAIEGMEPRYVWFLRWVSLAVATLIVAWPARPFFQGALRDLRLGAPGMDVPVALAIGLAYGASGWATISGSGEVYFDSIAMFTFFLGLGRYLEMRVRHDSDARVRALVTHLPQTARRLGSAAVPGRASCEEIVPARALRVGERVLVRPGEAIPTDGIVIEGESAVNESLLTGEARPVAKFVGSSVIGGAQNIDGPLVVEVLRVGADATLAHIAALLDRALLGKPASARSADRVARFFVSAVVVVAVVVGAAWWYIEPARALWVVLAVLVATCPCALSLATPAALAAASSGLSSVGFLVTRAHVLETLARTTHVVFDKTGTLTEAGLRLGSIHMLRDCDEKDCLVRACALEVRSEHPIARAFERAVEEDSAVARALRRMDARVTALRIHPNRGIEARIDGEPHRIGTQDFVEAGIASHRAGAVPPDDGAGVSHVMLGDSSGPIAWIALHGALRPDAAKTVASLKAAGIGVSMLSGDPSPSVTRHVGEALGISEVVSGATPEDKVAALVALQKSGEIVAAVGDGINDAPLLARAQVSIAMGGGTDLARLSADAVLMGNRLSDLQLAIEQARRTRRVIRQNLGWALVYNLSVLPLAACGMLAPWAAAIGMSASSLAVVANALRLGRVGERQ